MTAYSSTTASRVARALMYGGTALAVVGVGAWILDVIPPIPEWMVRIAIYKLTLAAAGGLILAGAWLRRSVRASAKREQLSEGAPDVPLQHEGVRIPVKDDRDPRGLE
jgi:hypothetical protein